MPLILQGSVIQVGLKHALRLRNLHGGTAIQVGKTVPACRDCTCSVDKYVSIHDRG